MFSEHEGSNYVLQAGLGKTKPKTLWAIYPLGHDEQLACPDLWSAHHYTDVANRLWGHLQWPDGAKLHFRAVEWKGSAESHAESLKEWPDAKQNMDYGHVQDLMGHWRVDKGNR